MSTAPQGWQTPKTNWQAADIVHPSDLNRIEGNIQAIESGSRTLDPSQVPSGNSGSLRQILSWFANRIKAIMGTTNWWDAPPVTLKGATPNTRKIIAGDGLAGGGDLSADRTITMGTPSTITAETANSVTSTSHTHALSGIARIATGSYTGNGVDGRLISVGFTPKCVMLAVANTSYLVLPQHSTYPNIVSGGFLTAGSSPSRGNYDGSSYGWVAFG